MYGIGEGNRKYQAKAIRKRMAFGPALQLQPPNL
jgi:hypothetical protein